MITSLATVFLAVYPVQPPAAPDAHTVFQWNTFGFAPVSAADAAVKKAEIQQSAPPSMLIEATLRTGGLLGDAVKTTAGCGGWIATETALSRVALPEANAARLDVAPGFPKAWFALDSAKREAGGAILTVDLNAMRTHAETLFDAPWLQRIIDRLALNNARLVSLRGALLPAPSDGLPPLLELKAVASARSEPPATADKPLTPLTLITPGWGGSKDEAAAIAGANWAASIRSDSGGLGQIGRAGGVGTWAGLIRLAVDAIGTAQNPDTKAWQRDYTTWQDRSSDGLRSLSTRLQSRATLACFGSAAAPDLVLIIPSRTGERAESLTKAMDQLAATCSLESSKGVWTTTATGPLSPKLAITISGQPSAPCLVITLEHAADRALLQQTATRLRTTK